MRTQSVLFTVAVFLAASLLFLLEPMVARLILPYLGGSAAVWNTSFLFFQVVLLLGYLYVHGLQRYLSPRMQVAIHTAILGLASFALPFAIPYTLMQAHPDAPVSAVLGALSLMVFSPFFAVSATSPLLQRWFSQSSHPRAENPYFLYAASNAGSFAGLLLYPFVVEPLLGLRRQVLLWAGAYGILAMLVVASGGLMLTRRKVSHEVCTNQDDRPGTRDALLWVGLSFVPSALCLSTTTFISTDIAAIPLLWVIPLALYLLTFVLAFSNAGPSVSIGARRLLPIVSLAVVVTLAVARQNLLWDIASQLAFLFVASLAVHGRLSAARPPSSHLTAFYLWVSLGGALGGLFSSLVAPQIFPRLSEQPLLIVVAVWTVFFTGSPRLRRWRLVALVPFSLLVTWFGNSRESEDGELHRSRTFYGRHLVSSPPGSGWRVLRHGVTIHGMQGTGDSAAMPTTYYHPTGPIGQVFRALEGDPRRDAVGIVGLGAGSLAAYAQEGQQYVFYELDPEVLRIASQPAWFTYLHDAARDRKADLRFVLGDGRLGLRSAENGRFGLLILDAFSSDAIPVHLLTAEALELYLQKTQEHGLIAFHTSNLHFHLRPVLATLAAEAGLEAFVQFDENPLGRDQGKEMSEWVVLSRSIEDATGLLCGERLPGSNPWLRMAPVGAPYGWTDDHANVISVFVGLHPPTPDLSAPICPTR